MLLKVYGGPDRGRERRKSSHFRWGPEAGVGKNRVVPCRCGPSSDRPGTQTVKGGDGNQTAGPGHPQHFGNSMLGIFIKKLDGGDRNGFVECSRLEGQPAHIAPDDAEGSTQSLLFGIPQHGQRKIEAGYL